MYAYFGLGSNLGNRLQNLREAVNVLALLGKVQGKSSVFETKAWGGVPQPDYLNACVKLELTKIFLPAEILTKIKTFEIEIGRVPSVRWGERKIDIDILLIDDLIYHSQEIDIPHIRIPERLFVLVPLKEILPLNWRHPETGKNINEMIDELQAEMPPLRITSL